MSLPPNVHLSTHPCLQYKLSALRSATGLHARTTAGVSALVGEIASILSVEVLGRCLRSVDGGVDTTPLGASYTSLAVHPASITLVPILRSGLAMVDAFQTTLHPHDPLPVHHLGMYREMATLQPVEYYNNLPYYAPSTTGENVKRVPELALILDPIIATGGTASAAITTLLDWGVRKVVLVSILGAREGVLQAADAKEVYLQSLDDEDVRIARRKEVEVEIWLGAKDEHINERGMIVPGVGDIGDRLFGTTGK